METLQLLAVALGLAGLAGINLYLTVFVTGLSIQQGWITLAAPYQTLDVLAHPAIIGISGFLFFVEFFADKVPWVDSLWDSVHTLIRPVGAAFVAIQVLGESSAVFDVIVGLLAGGTALVTHGVKATTRLLVNTSPEPFSNIALSVTEDVGVLAGLALLSVNPVLFLVLLSVAIATVVYFAPGLLRAAWVRLWLVWRKLNYPAGPSEPAEELPAALPADYDMAFDRANVLGEKIAWAVPCITGKSSRPLRPNRSGWLVATAESPNLIHFVTKRRGRGAESLELTGFKVTHEPRFLSENVVLFNTVERVKYLFVFDRGQGGRAKRVAEELRDRIAAAGAPEPAAVRDHV